LSRPEVVEETEHFLAPYATLLEPNPRSMKRLVNAFGLQHAVNLLSGVDVPLEALARWTILEQRWPRLAELLAVDPSLVDAFADENAPDDPRIAEVLGPLFTSAAVRRVMSADDEGATLGSDVIRRLVGEGLAGGAEGSSFTEPA